MRPIDLTDGQGNPMSGAEIDFLEELARSLPPSPTIVNIGADIGVSTCAFLEARPDATVYSVDTLPCEQEFENVRRCGLAAGNLFRVLGNSREIGPRFPLRCDLLFVDGDHWNAGGDILAWVYTKRVKRGGIVAFHDYMEFPPPENPGDVYAQVNAGMAEFEEIGWADRVIAFRMPE